MDDLRERLMLSQQAAPLLAFLATRLQPEPEDASHEGHLGVVAISRLAGDFAFARRVESLPVATAVSAGNLKHWVEDRCIEWVEASVLQRVRMDDSPPLSADSSPEVVCWKHFPVSSEDPVHAGSLVRLASAQGDAADLSDLVQSRAECAGADDSPLFPGCPHSKREVLSLLAQYKSDFVVGQRAMETLLAVVGHGIVPTGVAFPTTLADFDTEVSLHASEFCLVKFDTT